jgi:hypothetical protein
VIRASTRIRRRACRPEERGLQRRRSWRPVTTEHQCAAGLDGHWLQGRGCRLNREASEALSGAYQNVDTPAGISGSASRRGSSSPAPRAPRRLVVTSARVVAGQRSRRSPPGEAPAPQRPGPRRRLGRPRPSSTWMNAVRVRSYTARICGSPRDDPRTRRRSACRRRSRRRRDRRLQAGERRQPRSGSVRGQLGGRRLFHRHVEVAFGGSGEEQARLMPAAGHVVDRHLLEQAGAERIGRRRRVGSSGPRRNVRGAFATGRPIDSKSTAGRECC